MLLVLPFLGGVREGRNGLKLYFLH